MRRIAPTCIILLLIGVGLSAAQSYSFSVPEMLLSCYVNADASVTMEYEIEFQCSPGAHAIDVVDVGLPHKGYDTDNMSATVNGVPVSGIRKSSYIDTGVEVPLGGNAIQPGQRGRFTFRCTMPSLVYQDTTRKDYASFQITPTWFDPGLLVGTTELGVVVYLPQDIKPEEILHQGQEFAGKGTTESYTFAGWSFPATRVDGPHKVGLSFPKRNMDRVVKMTVFGLFMKWWRENPQLRFGYAVVVFILFGIMFFRASQGTGITVFVFLVAIASIAFVISPEAELLALPGLVPTWYLCERLLRRRRGKYLPAIASVEGGGVKRGLTAPEAAVLLEMPLGKVLTLVIFGLLKKGIVRQISAEPLEVEVPAEYANLSRKERSRAARNAGTVLRGYEQAFLDAIEANHGRPLERVDFRRAIKGLVEGTARRMKGFDLDRTRAYYRSIVTKAWAEANAIGEIERRTQYADDNLLWLLVADDYPDRFSTWHTHGYHYHAPWGRPSGPTPSVPSTPVGGRTSFSEVSASFAGWAEGITGSVASRMDPVSIGLKGGGLVDLSGVDKVTVDVLESLASSSGSGGGGGGCACAGCACACACAGGGR